MLTVPDIDSAIEYYSTMLGFTLVGRAEGWAAVRNGGVELMFALPNAHLPFDKPHFTGSLYFHLDDVDGLWTELKAKAAVLYPLEDFSYGMREFAILDNNGYILQFGSEVLR
jgi:uncharacterized glyoxalase superfamily protein PhnB